MTTQLLSAQDIYDVYGLEWVRTAPSIDQDDRQLISFRLGEIRDAYVHACKSRIRAEAKFLGIDGTEELTFAAMLTKIKDALGAAVQKAAFDQADRMVRGGGPPKLFQTILKAHQAAGNTPQGVDLTKFGMGPTAAAPPRPDVDPNWFMKGNSGRVGEDPKWAEIVKAYLAVEAARGDDEIIMSIDRLNQLQHNSFHVLIDLQTGRMLTDFSNQASDREARQRLQEVLNLKLTARTPLVFMGEMSSEVRKLLTKYRNTILQA